MVSEDLLSLLKSWKETGVTQIKTSTPGYLESKILVQFGSHSNYHRPACCIGSPRTRWVAGVGSDAPTRDICKALGLKTWALLPLHHLTRSPVQMEKLVLIPFCTMTSRKLLPGASMESLCVGNAPSLTLLSFSGWLSLWLTVPFGALRGGHPPPLPRIPLMLTR